MKNLLMVAVFAEENLALTFDSPSAPHFRGDVNSGEFDNAASLVLSGTLDSASQDEMVVGLYSADAVAMLNTADNAEGGD